MSFKGLKRLAKVKGDALERISMGGLRGVTDESFTALQVLLKCCEISVLPQRSVPLDLRKHKSIVTEDGNPSTGLGVTLIHRNSMRLDRDEKAPSVLSRDSVDSINLSIRSVNEMTR